MQNSQYYVWTRPSLPASFRVVRREVKSRTQKGIPISYGLKAIPGEYLEWDAAQQMADRLNQEFSFSKDEEWIEEDKQIY
jgi:hypothetical protein